jgi:hypothetical protein
LLAIVFSIDVASPLSKIFRPDVILDINKTIDYQRYVNLLNDWGAQCGWNAVQVEQAIFGLSTGR